MRSALPLLEGRFPSDVLEPAARVLDEVDESWAERLDIDEAELPTETAEVIKRALSEAKPEFADMPAQVARTFAVAWVEVVVISLWITAVISHPTMGEVTTLVGVRGLSVARRAGNYAGVAWDRLTSPDDPDQSA